VAGKVKKKTEPVPAVDSAHSFPPCRSTIALEVSSLDAGTVIANREKPLPVPFFRRDMNARRTFAAVTNRVAEQSFENLPEPVRVAGNTRQLPARHLGALSAQFRGEPGHGIPEYQAHRGGLKRPFFDLQYNRIG
jgi:hypothetical protein